MALRRCGRSLLLLRAQSYAWSAKQYLPAVHNVAGGLQLALGQKHRSGGDWQRQRLEEHLRALDPCRIHTHHLQTATNDSKADPGPAAAAPAAQLASSPAPAIEPDEKACDEAIDTLQQVKRNYTARKVPTTYKTTQQRLAESLGAAWAGTLMVLRWCALLPGRLWALRKWSREDWSQWWSSTKSAIKHEAHHYWVGFRLLWIEVGVASGLAIKAMRGNELTRRERRQLTRTTADLFRLVPMIVILVVPFMELLLPVLLALFPNMLPSTFEDKLKKEEQVKKRLAVKMDVARFLQDTVAEMAKDIKAKRTGDAAASADELYKFMDKVRAGDPVTNQELLRFAPLFNDELTLDNLDRVQLVSMCQFLGINPFGTDGFLRSRLRAHLDKIKNDDLVIQREGLDALNDEELRAACRARGMKAVFGEGAAPYMRRQMADWLDLHLARGMPSSLLLLSRTFTITTSRPSAAAATAAAAAAAAAAASAAAARTDAVLAGVKETLLALPKEVIADVGLQGVAAAPASADAPARIGLAATLAGRSAEELQQRLELIKKEQKLIKEEAEVRKLERKAEVAAALPPASPDSAAAGAAHDAAQQAAAMAAAAAVVSEATAGAVRTLLHDEPAAAASDSGGVASREEVVASEAQARERRMQDILSALAVLASNSGVAQERKRFMDLVRNEIERLEDTMGSDSPSLLFTGGSLTAVRPEDHTPDAELEIPLQLEERMGHILQRIEKEIDEADRAIGSKMRVLDLDQDGLISPDELANAIRFLKDNLDEGDVDALLNSLAIRCAETDRASAGAAAAGDGGAPPGAGALPSDGEGGAGQRLISVEQLRRLAETPAAQTLAPPGAGGGGGGAQAPTGASGGAGASTPAAGDPPKDSAQIHLL